MKVLLKDGIKYLHYKYEDEDELERLLIEHNEVIFGENSVFFPKHEIKARSGIATIPDGFVLLMDDKKWYILEVELALHPLHEHIVVQISKFNSAIKNPTARKKLIDVFYDEIKDNIQMRYKFESKGIAKELYKFLSDMINEDPEVIIVIDEKNKELDEVCETLPFRATVLEFKTYCREEIGIGVHIHFFDTLKDYGIKEQVQPQEEEEPQEITYPAERMIKITLRRLHTPRKYALIPISKEHRSFFPGYKEPFILETDIGEITTKVTGGSKGAMIGDPREGNYVFGGLKPWYEKHRELKEGDKLIIEEIEHKRKYRLSVEK